MPDSPDIPTLLCPIPVVHSTITKAVESPSGFLAWFGGIRQAFVSRCYVLDAPSATILRPFCDLTMCHLHIGTGLCVLLVKPVTLLKVGF